MIMAADQSWQKIFNDYGINEHDFNESPYILKSRQIKDACKDFDNVGEKEVRILCKQDTRESRPQIFKDMGLFLLPKKNGEYYILQGEGYIDIPEINTPIETYHKQLDFELESSTIGDSEMQHVDFAYANSLIRTFMNDPSLVLTIRGRKYTPEFSFAVGNHELVAKSVQTEVDAGYEGRDSIVLIEAKNSSTHNTIIRQLYYPFRQWQSHTKKKVYTIFFEKRVINHENIYHLWLYEFTRPFDYNSIELKHAARFRIV